MNNELVNDSYIKDNIEDLPNWFVSDKSITKEFVLKDFSSAVAFLNHIAIESEKIDHHPDLLLHSWNKLKVTLSTHSAGGLTRKDFELAKLIEKIKL